MSEEKPKVSVVFSVSLSDRSYESSLSIPVGAPESTWRPVVEAWLKLMEASLAQPAGQEGDK